MWPATTLALSCAIFVCVTAYPSSPPPPLLQVQQQQFQQQIPFGGHNHHRSQSVFSDTSSIPHSRNNQPQDVHPYARFDDEQVLRIHVNNMAQLKQLEHTVEKYNFDLWSDLRIGTVDVRVPGSLVETFRASIPSSETTVMIPNLQDLISDQAPTPLQPPHGQWNYTDNSFWNNYHDMATLNNFTEAMVQAYPKLVTRVSLGHTYEQREVFGISIHGYRPKKKKKEDMFANNRDNVEEDDEVDDYDDDEYDDDDEDSSDNDDDDKSWFSQLIKKFKKKPSKPKKNPKAIIIHAGLHAREWIGPAVATYIAKELVVGYHSKKKIKRLVDQFEFIIVPVLNADGYVYTWENNRMWRKNRQPTSVPFCPGIDPNRSWGYLWSSGGASANPCNEGYQGPEAFAAVEAKMMADFITQKKNVVAYLDFHAYSQLWMSPFGADCTKIPKDDEDIIEGAMVAAKSLYDVHNKRFTVGSICSIIVPASGGSVDWTYAVGNVKYSYSIQLRDKGLYGFLLPEAEILPSSEETMAGVMSLAAFIRKREKQWAF
ncbi:Carboxypeptidase A4 [Podila epigama]|nr:Carboxypeptidase A4 [Podila epigama]